MRKATFVAYLIYSSNIGLRYEQQFCRFHAYVYNGGAARDISLSESSSSLSIHFDLRLLPTSCN